MKKIYIIIACLICMQGIQAQKPLAKETIMDFASICWYNYRFGNDMFVGAMNTYLGYNSISKVATVMEHLDTDVKGRDDVFKVFYRISSYNYERLFQNLYSLNLSASESREIADYIILRNRFFQGTRRYKDQDGMYERELTIKGNKLTIKIYAGISNNNYPDKKKVLQVENGFIKNGKLYVEIQGKYVDDVYLWEDGKLVNNFSNGD